MLNEMIRFPDMDMEAGDIEIPEISFLGYCLSERDHRMLSFAQKSAEYLLEKIKTRQPSMRVEENFTIDVPYFWSISLPKGDKQDLFNFWNIYSALAKHFLPKANVKKYSKTSIGSNIEGVVYSGTGWYSDQGE